MLSILNRQASTLSAELDRYRNVANEDVEDDTTGVEEHSKEDDRKREKKRSKPVTERNVVPSSANEISAFRLKERENKKLNTLVNKLYNEIEQRDSVITTQKDRIGELGQQVKARDHRLGNMSLAMKSSELKVQHSDNRAIRTSQQIAGDAEAHTRKAVRRAEELEKTVQQLEAEAEV